MHYIILIFLFISSFVSSFSSDSKEISNISHPLFYEEQAFDVQLYDVELNFKDALDLTMAGKCDIHVNWRETPEDNEFYFHLRSLTVDSVLYNGTKVDFKKNDLQDKSDFYYSVKPPLGTLQNDNVITIFYQGLMSNEGGQSAWGGVHSRSKTLFAMGVGFMNNYVSTTRHWMPCYDHPSDKAEFKAAFIVPVDYMAVSTGLLVDTEELGEFTKYTWEHKAECATYMLTFAVSEYELIDLTESDLPIHIYAQGSQVDRSNYAFAKLPEIVNIFEDIFIEYPFDKVGYVITPIGAMEHQTMISMDWGTVYQSKLRSDSLNSRIIHELSHQWFGGLVTPYDFKDAWLNESFATFAEALFYENYYGRDYYLTYMMNYEDKYINQIAKSEGVLPLYDFPRETPSSNYPQTIYLKGAVVLGMLRDEIGSEVYDAAVKEYLVTYANNNVSTAILKEVFEEEFQIDLTKFFDDWVFSPGWPKYNVEVEYNIDKVTLNFENIADTSADEMTFDIEFEYQNGDTEFQTINLTEKLQSIELNVANIENIVNINFNSCNTTVALAEFINVTYTSVDREIGSSFVISPNPAYSEITIAATMLQGRCVFNIHDMLGNQVFSGELSTGSNRYDISDIPTGIYIIEFKQNQKSLIQKLIITH